MDRTALSLGSRVPTALLRDNILNYIVPPYDVAVLTSNGIDVAGAKAQLSSLAAVHPQWRLAVESVVKSYTTHACRLQFATGHKDEYDTGLNCIQDRSAVLQLTLAMLFPQGVFRRPEVQPTEPPSTTTYWTTLLASFPNLVRLDLTDFNPAMISCVLRIASTVCSKLKVLVLPRHQYSGQYVIDHDGDKPSTALVEAMKNWYESNGGLTQLSITVWPKDAQGSYDFLLDAMAKFCPQIQIIQGQTIIGEVSDRVWRRFWESCESVNEFTWMMAPLTESSIEGFTQSTKPRMDTLTIADASLGTAELPPLKAIQSTLRVCPNITTLKLWFPEDLNGMFDRNPLFPTMSGSLDSFAVTVGSACKALRCIEIDIRRRTEQTVVLTDIGLTSLVSLPHLTDLEINAPTCLDGDGLKECVKTMVLIGSPRHRRVHLNVSHPPHTAILRLMNYLSELEPSQLQKIRLELDVKITKFSDWLVAGPPINYKPVTAAEITETYNSVKARHGTSISYFSVSATTCTNSARMNGLYLEVNIATSLLDRAPDGIRHEVLGFRDRSSRRQL